MKIARRLFIVPLANDRHGKSTILRTLVSQGTGQKIGHHMKGVRSLVSPWGRPIDAFVFGRSFQEKEKAKYDSVEAALNANDAMWRTRELIIMPSHVASNDHIDIKQMIEVAHSAGFDAIAASVVMSWEKTKEWEKGDNRADFAAIWPMNWDERWTLPNPWAEKYEGQLEALGNDLWSWVARALAS
ncbi:MULTISPECIES: hypothetical protein [Agrobacterium]|uniref:hypothetical protein n=1 Tax=Agrobacterium TaxID=357 RepID=UPI001571F838|nr:MULTISPECIES: hypothetical protein [Agrobacterium]NTJ44096.1 hypothetical protein [Agrobacterium larrymoorei]WCK22448.1 hypothetical protein G6M09_025355 [Agrobacterium tumefaciens]